MRIAAAVALLALLAGCATPAPPDAPPLATGQIDGAVVDNVLRPFDAQPVYIVQTGDRDDSSPLGGFTFRDVPIGTYTLLASRDGYRSSAVVVEVEEDRITRVILQLVPIPDPDPYYVSVPHDGNATLAMPGGHCESCSWSLPIDGEPAEFILEALWKVTPLAEDGVEFELTDDLGNLLHRGVGHSDGRTPHTIQIAGADLHPDATRIKVHVAFDDDFTAQPRFLMEQVGTFFYGSTRHDLLFV